MLLARCVATWDEMGRNVVKSHFMCFDFQKTFHSTGVLIMCSRPSVCSAGLFVCFMLVRLFILLLFIWYQGVKYNGNGNKYNGCVRVRYSSLFTALFSAFLSLFLKLSFAVWAASVGLHFWPATCLFGCFVFWLSSALHSFGCSFLCSSFSFYCFCRGQLPFIYSPIKVSKCIKT